MWQPIDENTPRDGTIIRAGKMSAGGVTSPISYRWQDDRWCAMFGEGDWRSVEPQPTHWQPQP